MMASGQAVIGFDGTPASEGAVRAAGGLLAPRAALVVVAIEEGEAFEAREVELGARDNTHVEVRSGLQAGDKYVSENSFILKAEIGKEEAEHEY